MSSEQLHINIHVSRDNFDLTLEVNIDLGQTTSVFGPSGSGKSTLLRALAGFTRPQRGVLTFSDQTWFDSQTGINVPAHKRPIGYLFQDGRLFGHLNVQKNLDYAYRRRRRSVDALEPFNVVKALDLEDLMNRSVHTLSGGERQRVALGRTLISAPHLLLLDEPLAALDFNRKADILPYLEDLPGRFNMPTLFVSHDLDEVTHLADQVLSLDQGRMTSFGSIADLVQRLDLDTNTGRFDASVLVEGAVTRFEERLRLTHVDIGGPSLVITGLPALPAGENIRLRVHARDVAIATAPVSGLSIRNIIPGTISEVTLQEALGAADVWVTTSGPTLRARLTQASVEDLDLAVGKRVFALIKSASLDL
jgi:molybdate transport system ATP-binding protein